MEQLRARFPETGPAQRDGNGRAAGRNQEAAGIPPADAPSGSVGDYVLLEQLGRGGMGVVYRARDVRLQRDVAIKVLRDDRNDQQSRQRVLREAQAAARIDHANVVRVFAAACDERGSPYLVMQFIAGPSLAAQLTEQGSLAPRDAARIAAQAAHGLSAAHQQGLIHRDVKPSNILLDTDGTAKVSDFGLVWQAASATRFTSTGTLPGTPEYMSPEQVQAAGPVDARSDVYSLGVTLYELLTGELPFRGTPAMVLRQIVAEEPRRPRSLNDHVPRDLETIVLKAMEKNPASRYPSAKEMALDLDRWQRGEPIEARPIGPGGRLLRLCRRRPVASLLSAMLIAVTVLGFAGILWQWQRAEAQRAVAQRQRQAAQQQRARAAQEGARAEQQRQLAEQLQHRAERTLRAMRKEQQLKEAMQQEAEQQRYLANQARGQLVESVFQQQLTQDPTMEGAQRKFSEALQQAMAEFARRQRTNPQDRQRAAAALAAMAAMARRQQQVDRSIALYEKARTMFHALASQPGAGNETQQAVIVCSRALGEMYTQAMLTDRASVYLGQGRKLAETLLETSPERPDYKLELASTLAALSETRLAQGEKMSAEKTLARATELADGIDRTKVLDASFLPKLAALYERAAALHQKALDAEAGLLLQQRATVVWEECLARMPAAASLRKEGAGAFAAYGHALARAQRHAEAELAFCRAEELRETPVQSQSPAQAGRPRAGVPQVRRARAVAVGNGPARRLVRVKQLQIRGRRTHVVQPASPATVRWPKRREREQPKPMAKSD